MLSRSRAMTSVDVPSDHSNNRLHAKGACKKFSLRASAYI